MSLEKTPNWDKVEGLMPAIIQDRWTNDVLMLGYMNQEAYRKTKAEKVVTFFSRSKNRLWTKGETSGNFLYWNSMVLDCDSDTILIKVEANGVVCHTGQITCFGNQKQTAWSDLETLIKTIEERIEAEDKSSYTYRLVDSGIEKVAQKVGEEAVELVIESMKNDDEAFLAEGADLLFHYLVLLRAKGFAINDILSVLKTRMEVRK